MNDQSIYAPINLPDVVEEFYNYYQQPGNGVWGSLHNVLDDGNVRNHDIEFCLNYAREKGDIEGERLATILLKMSKTQRLKLPHYVDEYAKILAIKPDLSF